MIALDTNVLMRFLVGDDPAQAAASRVLTGRCSGAAPALICREVLVELVRVLERGHGFGREATATTLDGLLAAGDLAVKEIDAAARAAHLSREGEADFADLMIPAAAGRAGAPFYTVDRTAAGHDGARRLGA
ncbi:MAG: PIN domain-containing protein [Pseudomonadota bacterium]